MEVVRDVQTFVEIFGHPAILGGVLRNAIRRHANRQPVGPVVRRRAVAAQERHRDKRWLAVAVDVGEADAMNRRLEVNGIKRPWLIERLAALEPLQRAGFLGGQIFPAGAERKVELAVAVDVVGVDANIVGLRHALDDGADLPAGIF
jgi:hypothetical protein